MFAVEDIDDVVARVRHYGAELVSEIEKYEDIHPGFTFPRANYARCRAWDRCFGTRQRASRSAGLS